MTDHCNWNWIPNLPSWEPKEDSSLKLLQESSIHGVKYIVQPGRPLLERLSWILIVFTCIGLAVWLIFQILQKYNESPVMVSFKPSQTSIARIPFPAVTICNVNRFKKSSFLKTMSMAKNGTGNVTQLQQTTLFKQLLQLDHVCDGSSSITTKFGFSLNETTVNLKNRGFHNHLGSLNIADIQKNPTLALKEKDFQACPEMIQLCLWEGVPQNCSDIFFPIVTDYGICCTFNMYPNKMLQKMKDDDLRASSHEKILTKDVLKAWKEFNMDKILQTSWTGLKNKDEYPKRQSKAGQASGLSVLLNPELDEYFCAGHDGFGFRIATHSPINIPQINEFGLAIPPNYEVFMSTQADITVSDKSIEHLDIKKRFCYFVHESPLEFFTQYTMSNCIMECMAKSIMADCGCTRFELPYSSTSSNLTFCDGRNVECLTANRQRIDNDGMKKHCPQCKPSCNQIEFRSQTSALPMSNKKDMWTKDGKLATWAEKNVSIVHVFYSSDTVYSKVRKNLFRFNELFAQIGGVLGLFLGFSVISIMEPVYFLTRLYLDKLRGPRSQRTNAGSEINQNQEQLNKPVQKWNYGFYMNLLTY